MTLLLTIDETAERLGCSDNHVRKWVREGVLSFEMSQGGRERMMIPITEIDKVEDGIADGSIPFRKRKTNEEKDAERKLLEQIPQPHEHFDMVLIDDPTGEFIVGFGRFERGVWAESMVDGHWPDGSVWRGERGTKVDTLYQIDGMSLKEIASYSRHGRIANVQSA